MPVLSLRPSNAQNSGSHEDDSNEDVSMQDDASTFEISCSGEEVWSTINSVNVLPATNVTSNEIFELIHSTLNMQQNENLQVLKRRK